MVTAKRRIAHAGLTPGVYTLNGYDLSYAEASAYSAYQAGCATPAQAEMVRAWVVKNVLIHGTGVARELGFE